MRQNGLYLGKMGTISFQAFRYIVPALAGTDDGKGRKVEELVNSIKEAGSNTALFNGANLKAGMYIYKLVTANNAESGKLF